jgi:alpha-beta hydrolase superfamily lysophospholipase
VAPAFLIVQQTPFSPADRSLLRQLAQRRIAVLSLYGASDTTVNVTESAKQLRTALGTRSGSAVNVYAAADRHLLLTAAGKNDTVHLWPQQAAGAAEGIASWLKQRQGR